MGRARKFLIFLLILILALFITVYLFFNMFLDWATKKSLEYLAAELAKEGIELRHAQFKSSVLTWINTVTVGGFSSHMVMSQHNVFQIERNFQLDISKINFSVTAIDKLEFLIAVKDAVITMQPEYGKTYSPSTLKKDERDRFIISELKIPFRISKPDPKVALAEIQALTKGLAKLAKQGKTDVPVYLTALATFVIRDKMVKARMYVQNENSQYVLLMNKDDYRAMCKELGERLTETELELYSRNPLRVPRMTRIRNYASDQSREVHEKIPEIAEDAYKHVLWGYLLLNAYDETFSRKVTDAHEVGVIGRSELAVRTYMKSDQGMEADIEAQKRPEEVQMDLINNFVGRAYAKSAYEEPSLPGRVKQDERVVMHWMELLTDRSNKKPMKVPTVRYVLEDAPIDAPVGYATDG